VASVPAREGALLREADAALRPIFPRDASPPALEIRAPASDASAQARAALATPGVDVAATLAGPLDRPHILRAADARRAGAYLAALADRATRVARDPAARSVPQVEVVDRERPSARTRGASAFFAVFGVFFLTLFLSGQAVGTMAEERSNKVIEILAAAVPLESVFFGKLIGMFGAAVLFVLFWATIIINATRLLPPEIAGSFPSLVAAIGAPTYALLFIAYFTMSYMLLGAMFLSIGALTSTQRELQMLSLPITIFQMMMFGLALGAATRPGSWIETAAQVFPFSSPFAMIGLAGSAPAIWPHLLALGWQALWVAIIITVGARVFRRGVLKSGSPKRRTKIEATA